MLSDKPTAAHSAVFSRATEFASSMRNIATSSVRYAAHARLYIYNRGNSFRMQQYAGALLAVNFYLSISTSYAPRFRAQAQEKRARGRAGGLVCNFNENHVRACGCK